MLLGRLINSNHCGVSLVKLQVLHTLLSTTLLTSLYAPQADPDPSTRLNLPVLAMANLDSEASGQAARVVDRRRHDVYPFIDPTGNLKNSMKGKVVLVTGAGGGVGRVRKRVFLLLERL